MASLAPALYRFGGLDGPVAFTDCDALVDLLPPLLSGWPMAPAGGAAAGRPVIAMTRRRERYVLTSDWCDGEERYRDPVDAVCAFLAELIMAYGAADPHLLCLHAGAVAWRGRLIVFPARGKTGKSLLTAMLAARGGRVFSDDVLPVDMESGRGRALGIAPRLRFPLPAGLGRELGGFVRRRIGLRNRRYAYVELGAPGDGKGGLAPRGEEAGIGAFVRLERDPETAPGLAPASRSEVMRLLIRQHFGAHLPAPERVARFAGMVAEAPCYRLRFGGGTEAVALMERLAAEL